MDVVNSEKIEETFGINGYYGDGQMMNWFAPPTTIQNVRGVDYESTPHGVPTDEFWWIKQNRLNRERIANNIQNTTVIYPSGLPSGDRLEDYFNAEGDKIAPKSKFVFNTDFNWTLENSGVPMRRSFKKGDIIEGIVERNLKTSEPPNFFVSGGMRIGFGGRGTPIIIPYTENKVVSGLVEPKLPKGESKKFVFIKPFSTKIAVGGVVGVSTYSKKIGDMIDGEDVPILANEKSIPSVKVLINANPIQGADGFVYIPLSYLSKEESKVSEAKAEETKVVSKLSADDKILGMPKMVAIGGVVILAIGGFMVYKKFIKK